MPTLKVSVKGKVNQFGKYTCLLTRFSLSDKININLFSEHPFSAEAGGRRASPQQLSYLNNISKIHTSHFATW